MKEKCIKVVPCIDCISLPMCIQVFKDITLRNKNSMMFLRPLVAKCDMLRAFLVDDVLPTNMWCHIQVLEVYDYFDKVCIAMKE